MIDVDRSAGVRSLRDDDRRARERDALGPPVDHLSRKARDGRSARRRLQVRRRPVYVDCGVPCLPVALNSGLFWPRRTFMRYPGTISGRISRSAAARACRAMNSFARIRRRSKTQPPGWSRRGARAGALFGRVPSATGAGLISGFYSHSRLDTEVRRGCAVHAALGQLMQLRVAKSLRLDRLDGRQHVVAIVSGTAVALPDIVQLFGQ